MKKFLAFSLISMLSLAGYALAGGFASAQYQLNDASAAPTVVTEGMPLVNREGQPLAALSVTVADYNDGGADHDFIWLADARAWIWKQTTKYPDGGAGWMRAPDYDLTFDAGTASGVPIQAQKTAGIMRSVGSSTLPLPGAGSASRLYYQTANLLGNDAGVPRHTVLIEGRYGP